MPRTSSSAGVSRRTVLRATALGALATAAGVDEVFGQARQAPPNIVYIMADDLGYADVGCYGRPDIKTPNIDRIAARGVRFLQGYANSAVCSATRTALITGRYQYRLRVGLDEPLAINSGVGLPPEHPTLPSLLRKAGYGTTLIGKWHLGWLPTFGPLAERLRPFLRLPRRRHRLLPSHNRPRTERGLLGRRHAGASGGIPDGAVGSRAVDVINRYAKARQPFLLSLHFNAPHWPWEAPGDEAESERLRPRIAARALRRRHAEDVSARWSRRWTRRSAASSRRSTTTGSPTTPIVIFTSDNGGERFADTWPFTGTEDGTARRRTADSGDHLVARRGFRRARRSDQVSITMDWLPTLLAAAGGAPGSGVPPDGINLLPILDGERATGIATRCTGATRPTRSARCATAT